MPKFQPRCTVECYMNIKKNDGIMVLNGNTELIKQLLSEGYKFYDRKEVFFKSINMPDVNRD